MLGGTFLTMASHGTDQTMVQRLLAARNERDSKKALLASGVVIFVQFALFLIIGVMLFVYARHAALSGAGGDPTASSLSLSCATCPLAFRPCARCDLRRGHVQCKRVIELAGIV